MKLIYFPNKVLNKYYSYRSSKLNYLLYDFLKIKKNSIFFNAEASLFESLFNSQFTCYTPDEFHPIFFSKNLEDFEHVKEVHRYYDFFPTINKKYFNLLNEEKIKKKNFLNTIDLAIYSYSCHPKYLQYVKYFKENKIPICLIDTNDDQKIYKLNEKKTKKYLKKKHNKFDPDFVLVKDIKKKHKIKNYFPLNLVPISKFEKMKKVVNLKYNFSFIGNYRKSHMKDRFEIIKFLSENYNNSYMNIYEQTKNLEVTKKQQDQIFQKSKILVSPSGIIWDSYRHLGLYKYKKPVLMPKPLVKITKPEFTDMKNCIYYDVSIKNGKTILINKEKLLKKLNYLLKNYNIQKKIGRNYYDFVIQNHTSKARTSYLKKIFFKYLR